MPEQNSLTLDSPLMQLYGVGSERSAQLAKLKLHTVNDLLLHAPRRHEDRRHFLSIKELELNRPATTRGTVVALGVKKYAKGTKSVFELILNDGTARLHCRWWNLPFMENYFAIGDEVFVFGKPINLKPRTIDHPETEVIEGGEESSIHINRIAPIYPLTEGLPQRWLRALIWRTLAQYGELFQDATLEAGATADQGAPPLPARARAVRMLHFPEHMEEVEMARRRLALDEFIELQIAIRQRRLRLQANARALPCAGDNHLIKPLLTKLGFKLTEAQTKVLREIRRDMGGSQPMRRLLQGDVGSGKTIVAGCTALMAIESGYEVALMAPTEILAEQHFLNFQRWFAPLGVAVGLRTGTHKNPPGNTVKGETNGSLVIGTHALIQDTFSMDKLGLVIIDEQHKFGVAQREALLKKGTYPHLLVMTATPIPRTLGLTLYGDLDLSVIQQSPGGRGVIRTFVRQTARLPKVWEFVREKLEEGRQAYVVYPRVEDAGKPGMKAVKEQFAKLREVFAPFEVGLLHGRLSAEEKQAVVTGFREKRIRVLVATSVIEVGIDVANASVMVVENAEQFGLAQLHQLRGRIGRGPHTSYCILVAELETEEAKERLGILEQSSDGFRIAEADLKLRGPGELIGREQSGIPDFTFADLRYDLALVEEARGFAADLLDRGVAGPFGRKEIPDSPPALPQTPRPSRTVAPAVPRSRGGNR